MYIKPTDSELEILQVLWQLGPGTVRSINDRLNEQREVGYTTTLKIMQIMHEKGLVTRMEDSRSHVYTAAVQEDVAQSALLDEFIETTFRGSAMKLVMQALGDHEASATELDEIKALIASIEKNQQP
jgi:BlaI family transcriptional regulator, penicillinase repressor